MYVDRSGYKGPWSFSPTSFTNSYFTLLLSERWVPKTHDQITADDGKTTKQVPWRGPLQYTDERTGELMMLPSDMALLEDPEMRKWVEVYAGDQERFFVDFARAFGRLLELGVPERVLQSKTVLLWP